MIYKRLTSIVILTLIFTSLLFGQSVNTPITESWKDFSQNKSKSVFSGLKWNALGPVINSGRVEAIEAVANKPGTIYAGFGSGNLWKTTNHGFSWEPIFDNQAGYSIGDVTIAPSNSKIIYLATGESLRAKRGHTIAGAGMYKSVDEGKNWQALGLENSYHISRVVVHPTNPDIVFAAVLGHFYSPSEDRGVYKTKNGGKTWEKVLYVNERVGGNDVVISPTNPLIMYASTWYNSEAKAGPGGTLYKSIDGGDSWQEMATGFPSGKMNGRTGLAVSFQNSERVYAFTDNVNVGYEKGSAEVYRTDDGGKTWERTHTEDLKILSSYGEVFTDCFVNPVDDNELYILGVNVLRSSDAGTTFSTLRGEIKPVHPSPANFFHLDQHDMWINPNNPDHLIVGNDGGVFISYDYGVSWTLYNNLPVGEFYFVRTDNDIPYKIYSGTQDDSAVRGPAKTLKNNSIDGWEFIWIDRFSGGDGIVAAPDPENSNIVYYESQNGAIRRKNMTTGDSERIKPKLPDDIEGRLYNEWLTPYFVSKYDHKTIYYGANYMFKSMNMGDSWEVISPDLSKSGDKDRIGNGIIAMEESPTKQGLVYAGTSKGASWVTKDDGKTWSEISNDLPAKYIKSYAPSRFKESRVYSAQSGITTDAFKAYVHTSEDYGKTWSPISNNLPQSPVNVILEDNKYENVLYLGTFNGVYVSIDKGSSWHVLGTEMPNCFVADMTIQERESDLIAVTHGRGIYKIDLEPLHKFLEKKMRNSEFLYISKAVLPKKDASRNKADLTSYEDLEFSFYTPNEETIKVEIISAKGESIYTENYKSKIGLNTYTWDMTLDYTPDNSPYLYELVKFPEAGEYTISIKGGGMSIESLFSITK